MKKFIIKIILFFTLIFSILCVLELYAIHQKKGYEQEVAGSEVYHSIDKSKKKKKAKKLLIGDSVCKQLYDNNTYNDSIYSLGCNQAITVAGHFFLLNNFLKTNTEHLPQEVILFYNPLSFSNNVDIFAFQYFLKPFYNAEYKKSMNDYLLNRIKKIPLYYTTQLPFIKTSNYSPKYHLENENYGIFSPISKIYLEKIVLLCKEKNIAFHLEPTPISEVRKEKIEELKQNKEYIPDINSDILETYFNHIAYFTDTLFSDSTHFKYQYIPVDYLKLAHDIDSLGIMK